MDLKSWVALVGALIAGAAIIGLFALVGLSWILLGVAVGVGVISYIVAAVGASSRTSITTFGEFMRGWLVGMNAALNAVILFGIIGGVAGGIVGAVVGIINQLAVFAPISQSEIYQGVIGWVNWIMPMSWLIVGLGILFSIVSGILHLVTIGRVPYLKIEKLDVDWSTGTFFIKGGLIANLNHLDTAFNMGNFSFVDYKATSMHMQHEAGHTLNLGAFGFVFHLVGAIDENATPRKSNALSERIAESNDTGTAGTNIPMWA
jgi:MFS family permease